MDPTQTFKLQLDMGATVPTAKASAAAITEVKTASEGAAVELKQLETVAIATGNAATTAAGTKGAGGKGVLNLSYAFQDFMSVLTMGGGFPRAMMSITNNFDQLAKAVGFSTAAAAKMSLGFTGFVAVLPLLTPLFEKLWAAIAGGGEGPGPVVKALDMAEERVKRIQSDLEEIMKSRPFREEETRKLVKEFMAGQGPGVTMAVQQALTVSGTGARMTAAEEAAAAPEAIQRAIQQQAMAASRAGTQFTAADEARARQAAIANQQANILAANKRIAEENLKIAGEIVGTAPSEEAVRTRLRGLAERRPEFFTPGFAGELAELEPEAIARQEEEVQAEIDKGKALHAAGVARRAAEAAAIQAPKYMEGAAAEFRKNQDAQLKRGREYMDDATTEFRDLQRQKKEEQAQQLREQKQRERDLKQMPRIQAEEMAEGLMAQGPQIVGQAFGPQAAMMAQRALPADVQAMHEATVRNLMNDMLPYDAVLQAFMAQAEASERQARAAQDFAGRMNGITGRIRSSAMPSGLSR